MAKFSVESDMPDPHQLNESYTQKGQIISPNAYVRYVIHTRLLAVNGNSALWSVHLAGGTCILVLCEMR